MHSDVIFENDWVWGALQMAIWTLYAAPFLVIAAERIMPHTGAPARARLLGIADLIDRGNTALGHAVGWAALAMVALQFLVVVLRYVFGIGVIAFQEGILYLHAALFMVAAGYTLLRDGHVRVDILYRDAPERTKAWINAVGVYGLLMPAMALLFYVSWPYVSVSWASLETSKEASGLPVYPLKTLMLVFAASLLLQGWALAARSLLLLSSRDGRAV